MATDPELLVQVEKEAQEIAQAPPVERGPIVGRCHFCGQVASRLTLIEVIDGFERYKGECCGGT